MIVGDAGYGSIFLILSIVGKIIIKDKKMQLPLNLFALLSIMTIIWGALSGNYFAIPESMLPAWMHGISKPLTILPSWVKGVSQYQNLPVDEIRNKDVQYLCFLIAATHLSLARVWKAIILFPRVRDGLGQLGWGVIIWANFFLSVDLIVFNGSMPVATMYLYIIGAILVFACYVNWKDLGGVLNLPFSFIGSFVDVLSYIRLFAVGMSTFYIADSFNKMAVMVLDIPIPVVSVLGMIVILLFGHGLNILLSLIAVLVHGIRLNTLEFSNHMELQWMGFVYKPFKKIIPIKSNKEN
jgi:V/A-type H+-transporting ATPase subunit I